MPDSLAQAYAERMLDILMGVDGVEESSLLRDSEEGLAVTAATMRYPDGSLLAVRLIVDLDQNKRIWRVYSFQYMTQDGVCIFRYDNSRYHPEVSTFPHHKHVGADERVIACREPSIRMIRDEIEAHLSTD